MKIIYVCSNCSGTNVQTKAWIDANTREVIDTISNDQEDCWCEDCQENYPLVDWYEKSYPEEDISKWKKE